MGSTVFVDNSRSLPDPNYIEKGEEPFIRATLLMPEKISGRCDQTLPGKKG